MPTQANVCLTSEGNIFVECPGPADAHLTVLLPHALQLVLQVCTALRSNVNVVCVKDRPAWMFPGVVTLNRVARFGCYGVVTQG